MVLSVSVVLDTYNYGRFIAQAVESVLSQTQRPAEILVIDDGSTDETAEVMKRFGSPVTYLRKQNGGQASTLNFGIARARGEIVSFLDADDFWLPAKLAKVQEAFGADESVLMVQHFQMNVDQAGQEIRTANIHPRRKMNFSLDDMRDGTASFSGTSALSFRRTALQSVGSIPERLVYCPDEYLYTWVHFHGRSRNIPEVLSARRLHGANPSSGTLGNPAKLRVFIEVRTFLDSQLESELQKRGLKGLLPAERLRRDFEVLRLKTLEARLSGRNSEAWGLVKEHLAHRPPSVRWLYRTVLLAVIAVHPALYRWISETRAKRSAN